MTTYSATYSPDDNKLRLYASTRLDAETYARVKAAGFSWAPKQELFVAPMWTPDREDIALELAGQIDDEDTSLTGRAEQRAERFEDYQEKRANDAERAHKAVDAIADGIPFRQPILVGHHSERHARKDAERIENGMRKAVKMWETSEYWKHRAAGAIRHAKYKELPGVRHRRIKTIEADQRKQQRYLAELIQKQAAWLVADITPEQVAAIIDRGYDFDLQKALKAGTVTAAEVVERKRNAYVRAIERTNRWIAHMANRLEYERAMLCDGAPAPADKWPLQVGGRVQCGRDSEWLVILKINRVNGSVNSITTTPPHVVTWQKRWKYGVEEIHDYKAPEGDDAAKVKAATALAPLCNYPGEGFREMTDAEWKARRKWSDFPYIGNVDKTATHGRHRVRQMPQPGGFWKKQQVFITDAKRVDPPALVPPTEPADAAEFVREFVSPEPREQRAAAAPNKFDTMRDQLKHGVKVVTAPQLFPTPPQLAERMVELADIRPGHSVLEPSAGTGNLLAAMPNVRPNGTVTAVEINQALAEALRETADNTRCADFLECNGDLGTFDRILMNPPFERGADIRHIKHALQMLKPGGRLVAICANGPRQREALQSLATQWHDLPAGTFKEAGTGVNTALIVVDR